MTNKDLERLLTVEAFKATADVFNDLELHERSPIMLGTMIALAGVSKAAGVTEAEWIDFAKSAWESVITQPKAQAKMVLVKGGVS